MVSSNGIDNYFGLGVLKSLITERDSYDRDPAITWPFTPLPE